MRIYLGADHAGFETKNVIARHLEAKGHEGEELLLLYLDGKGQQVSASWAAASQWKTGG